MACFPILRRSQIFPILTVLTSFFIRCTWASDSSSLGQNLPHYLGNNASPWGSSRPGQDIPDTGTVRNYNFSITKGVRAPDGFSRPLILINGRYIGPTIEANWGDTIRVSVQNQLSDPAEGTSLHWHGQPQKLTPWMDGVPSVSQCPIAPGSSFTYQFRAETFGTSWYHAHVSAQYIDGLFGAMVIYGPNHVEYDLDLGPIIMQDYEHSQYHQFAAPTYAAPPTIEPVINNLLNGRNPFNCSLAPAGSTCNSSNSKVASFNFKSGKFHRLRLINAGGNENQKFSIDGHQMTVIAQDYVPLRPYNTSVVTLGTGQRTDVLVYGSSKPTDSTWMRADLMTGPLCGVYTTLQPNASATVYYEKANRSRLPDSRKTEWQMNFCANDPLEKTVPKYPLSPPTKPSYTQIFNINASANATGNVLLTVNNVAFYGDYNVPILNQTYDGDLNFPRNWSVYNFGSNSSVRSTWYNYFPNPHPMHLHGHNFWVLAEGNGTWDGNIVNPSNPSRRDTYILPPGAVDGKTPSYVVLEWKQDNPGIWPFHCHYVLHNGAGLYINSLERPDDIRGYKQIPGVIKETCDSWKRWSANHTVDQIDAGT